MGIVSSRFFGTPMNEISGIEGGIKLTISFLALAISMQHFKGYIKTPKILFENVL